MRIYDVAVIGGGPAGASFASELLRLCPDRNIIIIDGQTEARKKPCGGLLAPDAQKLFAELDLTLPKDILADPQIFAVETIDLVTRQKRYYQRNYLNMDRYRFDRFLLSLVPDSATVLCGRVGHIERRDEVYALTVGAEIIFARSLVGADGSLSTVRRFLGIASPLRYVAIQEWYKNEGQAMPYYSCIFDSKTSDSCSWTIHKDGYIIYGGAFERKGCRMAFAQQKARLEEYLGSPFGNVIKREACLVSSPRRPSDLCCGFENAYLIGEAAGFISASSFEGISSAIISGRLLALAYSKASTAKQVLSLYQKSTRPLRLKLTAKFLKRSILCSQALRHLIMSSSLQSLPHR